MGGKQNPSTEPQSTQQELRCPKCRCALPLAKYKQMIDLGIDGVRDMCPVCGSIVMISFADGTVTEGPK